METLKAIKTRYRPATNKRGSRILASGFGKSTSYSYYNLEEVADQFRRERGSDLTKPVGIEVLHRIAAQFYLESTRHEGERKYSLVSGGFDNDYYHVIVDNACGYRYPPKDQSLLEQWLHDTFDFVPARKPDEGKQRGRKFVIKKKEKPFKLDE